MAFLLGIYKSHGIVDSGSPTYDADSIAFFSRMTTTPSDNRKALIDAFVVGLKADSLWSKFDAIYILAAQDAQAAKLNLIQNAFNCTSTNEPTFTTNAGYTGGGTTYLDTNFNPASSGIYSRNSGHVSGYCTVNNVQAEPIIGNSNTLIYPTATATQTYWRVNVTAAGNATTTSYSSNGFWFAERNASNQHQLFKDGTLVATQTEASEAPGSDNMTLLRRTTTYGVDRGISFASIGAGGLSTTDVSNLNSRVATLLTGISAL